MRTSSQPDWVGVTGIIADVLDPVTSPAGNYIGAEDIKTEP